MKDPMAILMDEHRIIEKGLTALEVFAGRAKGESIPNEKVDLLSLTEFIREFADKMHHGKEEDILFDEMEKHGFPMEGGPVACMLKEHDEGRGYVRSLRELGEKAEDWTTDDRGKIVAAAQSFVVLLRQHIQKEDNILYPMAKQHLPQEAFQSFADRCMSYEEDAENTKNRERLHKLVADLGERYGK